MIAIMEIYCLNLTRKKTINNIFSINLLRWNSWISSILIFTHS